MSTPTCVQHVLGFSNENFETGNAFKLQVEPTLSGNCLVMFISYAYSATRTVTITDNIGNTWPTSAQVKTDDTTNGITTACYVLPNATAGVTQVIVTFDAALLGFYPAFSEWYNVATSSPGDGTANANLVTGGAISSGSFSTTTAGDLILHHGLATGWGVSYEGGYNDGVTSFAKNSGYTLLQCDSMGMVYTQYQVQSSSGATNPTMTFAGGTVSPDQFNSITLALKAATSGTAPTAGLRVFGKYHCRHRAPSTGNYLLFAPLTGSLAVIATAYGSSFVSIDSIIGSASGTWSSVPTSQPSAFPQINYKESLIASDSDVLTVHITPGGSTEYQFVLYDIINGGTYSSVATANTGAFGPGTVANMPSITPSISSGIAIGAIGFGTGPPDSITSPTGALFDSGFYTGYTDLSPYDSGDGYAHYIFSSNAAQNWTWNDTSATGSGNATVAIFTGAPAINTQPTSQTASPGQSVTFSLTATASSGSLSYQWYRNGSSVSGATSSSYTFTPNYPGDYGALWYCAVTDSTGTLNSRVVSVLWTVPTRFGKWNLAQLDAGDQDYKSELTILRWF